MTDIDFIVKTKINGIELYANNSLSDDEKSGIVNLGFKWHRGKRCFYAKDTENVRDGLRIIFGADIDFIKDTVYSTRQDILDDIKHTIDLYGDFIPTRALQELYEQHAAGIPTAATQRHAVNRQEINAINKTLSAMQGFLDM